VEAKTEAREKNNRSCPFRKQEKQKQKKNNRSCPFRVSFSEAREKKTEARESRDQHLSRKTKPPIEPKNRYTKQEKKMFSKFIQPYT
jgi:hypothetical protein